MNKVSVYETYDILLMTNPCYIMPLPLSRPERGENERNELDGSASKFHKHFIKDNNMIYFHNILCGVQRNHTWMEKPPDSIEYLQVLVVRLTLW